MASCHECLHSRRGRFSRPMQLIQSLLRGNPNNAGNPSPVRRRLPSYRSPSWRPEGHLSVPAVDPPRALSHASAHALGQNCQKHWQSVPLDALLPVWQHAARMSGTRNQFFLTRAASVRYGVVFETACACAGDAGRRQTGYAYCYLERRTWESKGVTEQ